ncbi:MAG: hypothetical protein HY738_20480 [Bacteroidia bacterium]|nr:hypothetical protein [Bacteroidia bacterium]
MMFELIENETVQGIFDAKCATAEYKEKTEALTRFLLLKDQRDTICDKISEEWHIDYRAFISHPDTHEASETFGYSVNEFFGRKFRDVEWFDKLSGSISAKFEKWTGTGFRSVFKYRHVILPVIHTKHAGQTLKNARIAYKAGADGVFLINQSINSSELFRIYEQVRLKYPDWWIGINYLGLQPEELLSEMPADVNGIWSDDAGINENEYRQPAAEKFVMESKKVVSW